MSQLKKGAILSYVNIGLTNIIGLILTPFIIRSLGDSEYGLYTLIGSFVAYLSLMDLGLNNTIVRFVAKYRTEKDILGEQRFLGSIFIIYIAISILVIILGLVFYYNLDNLFSESLTIEEMGKAKIMYQILILNMAIVLPGGAFTAICNAYERFVWPRGISIIKYISRAVIIVAILTMGGKAISLVVIDTVLNVIVILATLIFVFKRLKVKVSFKNVEKALFKKILSYSIWIFLMGITSQFLWNAGQVLLGMKTDTRTVAFYGVGIMLGGYYGAFSAAISGVFLPRATQMSINNTKEEILEMMVRIGRLSFLILGFILTGFIIFGKEFIFWWVGEAYSSSYIVAVIIMLAYTLPLILTFANSLLEAYNKVRFKVLIYIVFFSLGLVLGYFLIPKYQEVGMIIGVSAGWMISQVILMVFYHKVLGINMMDFFKKTFNRTFVAALSVFGFGYFLNTYLPATIFYLIFKVIIYSGIYWSVMYFYAMNIYEKQLIKKRK